MKFGLKWVHMLRYELILKLDGPKLLTLKANSKNVSLKSVRFAPFQIKTFGFPAAIHSGGECVGRKMDREELA